MTNTQFTLPFVTSDLLAQARIQLATAVRAPLTVKGYARDWSTFQEWSKSQARNCLPASQETIALYVTAMLNLPRRVTTVMRHLSAIVHYHRLAGLPSPWTSDVQAVLTGAQRLRGEQPRQKSPITLDKLRQMVATYEGNGVLSVRNRAILLLGFATALRCSNIVALNMSDLEFTPGGLLVRVRREKQDQQAKGRMIGVPPGKHTNTCAVTAVRGWIEVRQQGPGPLFLGSNGHGVLTRRKLHQARIGRVVKTAAEAIGLDPSVYGAHSLRAGFVTEAVESGVSEFVIATQTGHRSLACLRRYFRPSDPFRANACTSIGL